MKKIIELILSTKFEINTDKNGKSVILYSDNKEAKEIREIGKFNEGDYAIFKSENKLYKGIITDIRKAVYTRYNIFVPLENIFFCGVDEDECFHPTAVDIEEIEFQMLKIGKKWNGKKIVDIVWSPKNGENYYYINAEGEICGDKYDGNIKWIDEQRFDFGNCFKTGEEAVSYRNKIKELLTKRK